MPQSQKSKKQSGLMSSAGLMRYYEAEESVIKISPKTVVWAIIFIAVLVIILNVYYGKFPVVIASH